MSKPKKLTLDNVIMVTRKFLDERRKNHKKAAKKLAKVGTYDDALYHAHSEYEVEDIGPDLEAVLEDVFGGQL